jgi:hypothetical protein
MRLTKLISILALTVSAACATKTSSSEGAAGADGADGKADGASKVLDQSAYAKKIAAKKIAWLLEQSQAKAITCKTTRGKEITLAKGTNVADDTGLVVTGDYSYGTNEIREVLVAGNLMLEFGEEGNYQLAISNFTHYLFGYDGPDGDPPSLDDSVTAVGAIMSEGEVAETVTCDAVR